MLNASSLSCSTLGSLPSTTTQVSIAGNYPEFGYYVNSGMNSFGDRRIKYSSASALAEYTIPHTIDISHGADSQCVAIPTDVQCKDYQGGSLVSSTNSPSSISNVTVNAPKNATDLSIGSNFRCALANNDSANY